MKKLKSYNVQRKLAPYQVIFESIYKFYKLGQIIIAKRENLFLTKK